MFRIGMIGMGIIAASHIDAIEHLPSVKLICIADIDISKCEIYTKKFNIPAYRDYKEMINEHKLDLVIVNLPHFLHKEASIESILARINVLVEKPMALSYKECDEIIYAAHKNNVKLFIGHISRYSDCINHLKDIVVSKKLGKLTMINEKRYTDYFRIGRPNWFFNKKLSGGGIVFNLGAHFFDHIHYTTNQNVKTIKATVDFSKKEYDIEGSSHIFCELDNNISASCILYGYSQVEEYQIDYIFVDGMIKINPHNKMNIYLKNKKEELTFDHGNIFRHQLSDIIKCITNDLDPLNSGEYGKKIVKCIESVYETSF